MGAHDWRSHVPAAGVFWVVVLIVNATGPLFGRSDPPSNAMVAGCLFAITMIPMTIYSFVAAGAIFVHWREASSALRVGAVLLGLSPFIGYFVCSAIAAMVWR